MTPEMRRDFEAEWPSLATRLRRLLFAKKVPSSQVEDYVQETGLRLYRSWERVDRSRSAWAFTATIALNLVRDEARRAHSFQTVPELPDMKQDYDLERAGIARLELQRVNKAIAHLSPAHRAALLTEVGAGSNGTSNGSAAAKMLRLRARRKLCALLDKSYVLVGLRWRRAIEIVQGAFGATREQLLHGVSCLLCLAATVSGAMLIPPPSFSPAIAHPAERGSAAGATVLARVVGSDEGVRFSKASPADADDKQSRGAAKKPSGSSSTNDAADQPSATQDDAPVGLPDGLPDNPIPGGGGDNVPELPEPPPVDDDPLPDELPELPNPPPADNPPDAVAEVKKVVAKAVSL